MNIPPVPAELADLADGDASAHGFLALAEGFYQASNQRDDQLAFTGAALRILPGTMGRRFVLWEGLTDAVERWHYLDVENDGVGTFEYPSLPSREQACDEVCYWLAQIARSQAVVGVG